MCDRAHEGEPWWQGAVFYQIYPRSFQDSNGDGIGDLPGILRRLDHVASLGVDAIWLSPICASPQRDFGYDVSDYTAIDPCFGTMDDFLALLRAAHDRGLKLVLDLVLNHTSAEHPWFKQSRASRTGPHADWYIWADGRPDRPPNNWLSYFGGSAWEWEPARGQYFLHSFLREQPDLDWRCVAVKRALFDAARFWLDLGVDGFRLDVVNFLFKDARLRDEPGRSDPPSPMAHRNYHSVFRRDRPEALLLVEELRELVDAYPGRVLVGEVSSDRGVAQYLEYSKPGRLHLVFDFALKNTPRYDVRAFYEGVSRCEEAFGDLAWPCHVLGNHDTPRIATRFGGPSGSRGRARVLAAMLLTLRGTPFLYYGDEIGMPQASLPFELLRDPKGLAFWPHDPGRDGCRTPMCWDATRHAGFSEAEPWLPVAVDGGAACVAAQERDPGSLLCFCRRLIALRRASPALRRGAFRWLLADPTAVLAYERRHGAERQAVVLNFCDGAARLDLAALLPAASCRVVLGSDRAPGELLGGEVVLGPHEVLIAEPAVEPRGSTPLGNMPASVIGSKDCPLGLAG
ncbi:MAG: alpha-glucosidase C-terminal domain-containing protein [Deltaproteobacteria bacterium]|nr:alpha-glucosidase C-terminal domain-containing protein [Deltaproteobacteria bacterium]